jgi:transposase
MLFFGMRGDLKLRKVRTKSGSTSVQVVRYGHGRREIVKHIGSADNDADLAVLMSEAQQYVEKHCAQPDLFAAIEPTDPVVSISKLKLLKVTQTFARRALLGCARLCGLDVLHPLFQDLAIMRIVEPESKRETIKLLKRYFQVSYSETTVYTTLSKLLVKQQEIERLAIQTAREQFNETFSLILYDVTTLYFESFKDYDLQTLGFSKDNKPQQPQIVVGLITTRSGFPVMHEVFEGKTFEGHTMLKILDRFQKRFGTNSKPVIVADAAMLSVQNMSTLQTLGYRFIVGARLANLTKGFIDQIYAQTPRHDEASVRLDHVMKKGSTEVAVKIVCQFKEKRYKKDRNDLNKQIERAQRLLDRNEPGRRARFVKKAADKQSFELNVDLKAKAEKLLGIKGYVTNIPEQEMPDKEIIEYYHDLWHVEQAFRMTKSDLETRPIFHYKEEAIKAHVLVCFMGLMISKYLQLKTGLSIKEIRSQLMQIHEAHLLDQITGKTHVMVMDAQEKLDPTLMEALEPVLRH